MRDPLERLRDVNPVPDPGRLVYTGSPPEPIHPDLVAVIWAARRAKNGEAGRSVRPLHVREQPNDSEVIMPTTKTPTTETPTRSRPRSRSWLLAAAAGAVVLLALFWVANGLFTDDTTVDPVEAPAEPAEESVEEVTPGEALAVKDAYFAAYEAGDVDAMTEVFAPDVSLMNAFGEAELDEWRQLWAYKVAEGTVLTSPECEAEPSDTGVTVICSYGHHEHVAQVVDAPPVRHTLTMEVGSDGVTSLTDVFGQPDFTQVFNPFEFWMREYHPEDAEAVGVGGWESIEGARAAGMLTAEYADRWAAFLEEHDCAYYNFACVEDVDAAAGE